MITLLFLLKTQMSECIVYSYYTNIILYSTNLLYIIVEQLLWYYNVMSYHLFHIININIILHSTKKNSHNVN